MYLSVIGVKPLKNYKLLLKFENNEERIFDVNSLFNFGRFNELKAKDIFNSVRISFDTIQWSNNLDLDPEFLYKESKKKGVKL